MSPVSLLSFCSPSGDTEIICQLPKSLWALVLEIHFPERGTAQCHPLLTHTSCETETKDRWASNSTGSLHWAQSCKLQGAGSKSAPVELAPGRIRHLWMTASLLGGSGEEKLNQWGFQFLNPNNEGWGRRQGQRKCWPASLASN